MINVKANLDNPKSIDETAILFSVSGNGVERFRVTSGIKVRARDWNQTAIRSEIKIHCCQSEHNRP